MRGLLLIVLSFANLQLIWSPDVLPNTLFAWTVVRSDDVTYDEFVGAPGDARPDRLDREAYFFRACGVSTADTPPSAPRSAGGPPAPGPNDHVCSIFPPGMAILALPVLVPAVLAGVSPGDATALLYLGHLAAAIVEAIATLLLWSVLGRFVTARWALTLTLLYALATSVRTVASQALWQARRCASLCRAGALARSSCRAGPAASRACGRTGPRAGRRRPADRRARRVRHRRWPPHRSGPRRHGGGAAPASGL